MKSLKLQVHAQDNRHSWGPTRAAIRNPQFSQARLKKEKSSANEQGFKTLENNQKQNHFKTASIV